MMPGAARPTVNNIAREAGVSLATVDRVMTARPGVRAVMVARVHDAIARRGHVRDVTAANLARRQMHRLAFVLPDGRSTLLQALWQVAEGARGGAALARTELRVVRVFGALLAPQVRDAVRRVHDAGVAVVAQVSDQPAATRARFVGIDDTRAGRRAGWLPGRFLRHPRGRATAIDPAKKAIRIEVLVRENLADAPAA